jgi:(R,R)-butanediol dehydrogenase/meso-butanediol dehydrogenase/diacetyl reductase
MPSTSPTVSRTAAYYTGAGTFQVDTASSASTTPGHGEVTVAVAYTGVCGTDLHIYHGDMDARVTVPGTIGHEMSGEIAAIGEGVTDWAVGDHVTAMPLIWCGSCKACSSGNQHICQNLNFVGIDSTGSMQSHWTIPAGLLVALPADLDLAHAALTEPTAVAVHDVGRAALKPGERIVVVGGGPVGLLIATVARSVGADIVLVEPNPARRALAERLGFRAFDGADGLVDAVRTWTDGAGADVTFEVSGSEGGVRTAVDLLGPRGRLVLVAIHGQPRPVDLHQFFWRELTLIGARLYDRSDFEKAVELVADGTIPAAQLISLVTPLSAVSDAFAQLGSGDAGLMKVLIDCRRS